MPNRRETKILTLAQSKVPEPVVCAALFLPKGKSGAMMLGGLTAMAINNAMKAKEGFASTNILAVANSALYAFEAGNNFGIRIKDPIGVWPWGSFGASTKMGGMTQFLYLGWGDGSVSSLEVQNRGTQKFQGAVVDEIVRRAMATGAIGPPTV